MSHTNSVDYQAKSVGKGNHHWYPVITGTQAGSMFGIDLFDQLGENSIVFFFFLSFL